MQEQEVKIGFIKSHDDAILPTKAHDSDNCWDLYAVEDKEIPHYCSDSANSAVVEVGLKVGYISPGFGFVIRPRSGLGFKYGIMPHLGEIDNGYRGGLGVKLYNFSDVPYKVKKGDRIAQIKIEKVWHTTVEFIKEAIESSRGEGGFGSSGK